MQASRAGRRIWPVVATLVSDRPRITRERVGSLVHDGSAAVKTGRATCGRVELSAIGSTPSQSTAPVLGCLFHAHTRTHTHTHTGCWHLTDGCRGGSHPKRPVDRWQHTLAVVCCCCEAVFIESSRWWCLGKIAGFRATESVEPTLSVAVVIFVTRRNPDGRLHERVCGCAGDRGMWRL